MVIALFLPFVGGPIFCSLLLRYNLLKYGKIFDYSYSRIILQLEQCKVIRRRSPSEMSVLPSPVAALETDPTLHCLSIGMKDALIIFLH